MRLTELFENDEMDLQQAMLSFTDELQDAGASYGNAIAIAKKHMRAPYNKNAEDAANIGKDAEISRAKKSGKRADKRKQAKADRHAAHQQAQADRRAALGKDVDRVKPTITKTPDADRTRQDTLGRNLKADRYYNQLNKTPKGRELIKRAVAKLGVPEPAVDQIIDVIADDVPSAIQQLDNILKNPAAGIRARQARNQST